MTGVTLVVADEYASLVAQGTTFEVRNLELLTGEVSKLDHFLVVLDDMTRSVENFKLSVRDFREASLKLSLQDPWRKRKISQRFPGPRPESSPTGRAHASRPGAPGPQWRRRARSQLQTKYSCYQGNF